MIICDVDGQKLVNDTFGHAVGDQKLIELSKLISMDLEPEILLLESAEMNLRYYQGGKDYIVGKIWNNSWKNKRVLTHEKAILELDYPSVPVIRVPLISLSA
jgi:FOG: GGDEF domain